MKLNRVVVTGLGALTPIGNNIKEYWSGLVSGKSGAAKITHFNPEKFKEISPLNEGDRLQYEGGFGIPLMRVLADEIQIDSADEGTTVQLVVYIPPSS